MQRYLNPRLRPCSQKAVGVNDILMRSILIHKPRKLIITMNYVKQEFQILYNRVPRGSVS